MTLGCFATEVGGQFRNPAESIFLLLIVKASSSGSPESHYEIPLVPCQALHWTPTHPLSPWPEVLFQLKPGLLVSLCLPVSSPAHIIPELLIRFPGLIPDWVITSSLSGWWVEPSVVGIPAVLPLLRYCGSGICWWGCSDACAGRSLSWGLPSLWNSLTCCSAIALSRDGAWPWGPLSIQWLFQFC